MTTKTPRRWKLDQGLKDLSALALPQLLKTHTELWIHEATESGEIGEETRTVLIVLGVVTSGLDPRLSLIPEPAAKPVPLTGSALHGATAGTAKSTSAGGPRS